MKFELSVKVNPNSSRRLFRWKGDHLKVNLTSPPEKGKANDELVTSLAELFGLRSSDINLKRGATSRKKTLTLKNISKDHLQDVINSLD